MKVRLAVLLAIVAAVVADGGPTPVGADEFIRVPANSVTAEKADYWNHDYCFGATFLDPAWHTIAHNAMGNLDAQTSYTVAHVGCTAATGVTWELAPNMPGIVGYEWCWQWNLEDECTQASVHLDSADLTTASFRASAACHELGHTLGLTHGSAGCMRNPVPTNSTTYSAHHVAHVQTSHDSPIGQLDSATRVPGGIRVIGWALDPDIRDQPFTQYQIYVDITPFTPGLANVVRPDIAGVYPYWGAQHGLDRTVTVGSGPNQVCLYGLNTTGTGGASALLGCRVVP